MFLTAESLNRISLSRYEIALRSQTDTLLPPFLGSTLRGAFGHALKTIACSMPHGDCPRCFLVERCLYPKIFETSAQEARGREITRNNTCEAASSFKSIEGTSNGQHDRSPSTLLKHRQDAPRPFVFIPPQPASNDGFPRARDEFLRARVGVRTGETVSFGLSLFGDAIHEVPYIIYAVSLMAQHGFGAARAPFVLEKVFVLDAHGERKTIYTEGSNRVSAGETPPPTLGELVQARLRQVMTHGAQPGADRRAEIRKLRSATKSLYSSSLLRGCASKAN